MRALDIDIKQRLQRAIDRPLSADWPSELHRDALAEIAKGDALASAVVQYLTDVATAGEALRAAMLRFSRRGGRDS